MAVDVVTEIEIGRLRAETGYVSDPDNVTTWYENITPGEAERARPASSAPKARWAASDLSLL